MNEQFIRFSVVRLIADSVREISVPVGVIAEYGDAYEMKFIEEVSPALRALAHPTDRQTAIRFSSQVAGIVGSLYRNGTRLEDLASEGIGGFIFGRPRELLRSRRRLSDEVSYLYHEFVAPRKWPSSSRSGQTRLGTQVRRTLRTLSSEPSRLRVPIDTEVEFQVPGMESYTFDGAVANGTLTLLKSVDLSVQRERQKNHTNEAIAEAALLNLVLEPSTVNQVAVTNPSHATSSNPDSYVRALRRLYKQVFLFPEEKDKLEEFVMANAQEDVVDKARRIGLDAERYGSLLVIESAKDSGSLQLPRQISF